MALDPVVIQIGLPTPPPESRFTRLLHLLHLPHFGQRSSKIITAVAAIVIALTMTSFVVFSALSNNNSFKEKHGLNINQQGQVSQTTGSTKSSAALPGGGVATGVGGTSGTNSPEVTLTADPAAIDTGGTVQLKWSVTKNPKSCVASDDWNGTKSSSGSETTPALTKVQVYLFTITCKTDTGTGYSTVSVAVSAPASASSPTPAGAPEITIAAAPSSIYTNEYSTLNWTVTNSPTSCTASGDWSGTKSTSGPQSTGNLITAKTYNFTLVCTNSYGTSAPKTAQVLVRDPPPNVPIVTISGNPVSPVTPGTTVKLTWSSTNNPTSCIASGDNVSGWGGAVGGSGTFSVGPLNTITTYNFKIACSNSAGVGTFDTDAIQVLPNPPGVSVTLNPASMYVGNAATIIWSITNITSKTTCTGSGSWPSPTSVTPLANGSVSTGIINSIGTYLYSLSCTNEGGEGHNNNVPLNVTLPPLPTVNISVNPIAITVGSSATITYSSTNSSNCNGTGTGPGWAGGKLITTGNHVASTNTINTVGTYTYILSCTNAAGTVTTSTSLSVSAGGGTVVAPTVTIAASPPTIGTGSSSTITWSTTGSPTSCTSSGSLNAISPTPGLSGSVSTGVINTAGTYTYTLSCSNSAGSATQSAVLTVIAIPVISITLSPTSINVGSTDSISWNVTNYQSPCTASGTGGWTGSKGASGSNVALGTFSTAGSFTFILTCTNTGGTATNTATLTVTNPAPVYCGGKTTCYGPNDLALHASSGNCWGWNIDWVVNITSFRPSHLGGIQSGSTSTLESPTAVCDHDIHAILAGTAAIAGYKDSSGSTTHSHQSATINNSASSAMTSYRVGYYDATKP